jgi:RNA polymerase sigma-70 factor (ECF subfamily)
MRTNERALLARLQQRDDPQDWLDAWETLVHECGNRVYGLSLRMLRHPQDAEDATQEVWERALAGLSRFRGDSSLATWLYSIAMNVCLTRIDRAARSRVVTTDDPLGDDLLIDPADDGPDAERCALSAEARVAIERALGELDPALRAVILLRDREDLRYEEIAQILDIPINTVKTRIHRARLALQEKLEAFRP